MSTGPLFVRPKLLLHQPLPRPLHGVAPRIVFGKTWWDETRGKAAIKNRYCCWACGVAKEKAEEHTWLEGHEAYNIDFKKGRAVFMEVVSLCHYCHCFIHLGRLQNEVQRGFSPYSKVLAVEGHGLNILVKNKIIPKRKAHLNKEQALRNFVRDISMVPWSQWRLVIYDKEYTPELKTQDAWRKRYGK